MQSSLVYISPIREPSSNTVISTAGRGERKDGTGNGSAILTSSQTLDHYPHHHHHHHHHHHQQQQQQQRQPPPPPPPLPLPPPSQHSKGRDPPDADPDPVSTAVVGAKVAPIAIAGESNLITPQTKRNPNSSVRYLECLKNHAASIGGHVIDGCGEFMPIGKEGTPEALKCAVCNCHRNFHRKDVDGEPQSGANFYYCYNPSNKINSTGTRTKLPPPLLPPPPPLQEHRKFPIGVATSPLSGPIPPLVMAFGGGGGVTESSSEELNVVAVPLPPPPPFALSRKRFRTKFSQEQKEKMMEFAEKIGWRIQKQDETLVEQFCAEVGVKRRVLKVWMHNNKHSMKKKEL